MSIENNLKNSVKTIEYLFESNKNKQIENIKINFNWHRSVDAIFGEIIVDCHHDDFEMVALTNLMREIDDYVFEICDKIRFNEDGTIRKKVSDDIFFMFAVSESYYNMEKSTLRLKFIAEQVEF